MDKKKRKGKKGKGKSGKGASRVASVQKGRSTAQTNKKGTITRTYNPTGGGGK